jgi:CHAD domain-containing protein
MSGSWPCIGSNASLGDRLGRFAAGELEHALDCLGWQGSKSRTGIHQARKSMRPTRATLGLARQHLGRAARTLDEKLRDSNKSLSDLRDGQALIEAIDRLGKLEKGADSCAITRRARAVAVK